MNRPMMAGVVALALALSATAATAQDGSMSVQAFVTSADRIPHNPTALLRPDARRLMNEVKAAFRTLRAEQTAAQTAGRRPATCMPERAPVTPETLMNRLHAIPAARRNISITQAMREWMAERYPCPAA